MPANKFNPVGNEILVNTTVTTGQVNPAATYLSDGRLVIAWMDGSARGGFPFVLTGQLFDSSGNKSGGEFVINNDSGDHQQPSITALSTGGFVAVWTGGQFNTLAQFQIFDSNMNKVGSVVSLQNPQVAFGTAIFPDVTALADGNFVVAWTDIDGHTEGNQGAAYFGTFAQTFSPTGTALDTAHLVNSTTKGEQGVPSLAGLAQGGYVVVWQDDPTATGTAYNSGFPHDLKARIYAGDGTPGAEFLVNTTTAGDQRVPEVAMLSGGGFVVVWTDASATGGDTSGSSIRAQVFDGAGNRIGGEILVNSSTAGNQYGARVEGLPSGGFIVAWSDAGPEFAGDTNGSIRGQVFNADGSRKGDEGVINSQTAAAESDLVIDVRDDGSFALAWSEPDGTGSYDVKMRFFAPVIDDPAVAQNDAVATTESSIGTGNLFVDNGSGADFDPDGGPSLSVAAVNGVEANVGQPVTLASGARVTVNADGTYSYDPNGQFTGLADASSGAVNTTANDSFTYTLVNGNTATVSVTINGVASPNDILRGDGSDNVITGSRYNEMFMLQQGGADRASGQGGNDNFYVGGAFTAADFIDGGSGTDVLALQGNYSAGLTFGTGLVSNIVGIESISLVAGNATQFGDTADNRYDYVFTMLDSNVAAGVQLKINGGNLLAGEDLTVDGSAETNGTFLIYGGKGVDILTGGSGNDVFFFAHDGRLGAGDQIDGGGGVDALFIAADLTVDFTDPAYLYLVRNVENITLSSVTDTRYARTSDSDFDYDIITDDGMVAAGTTLTINAGLLQANETMKVDAHFESDANLRIFAGASNDTIKGGALGDTIYGGKGSDELTGNGGNDVFRYDNQNESTTAVRDHIMDLTSGEKIDLYRIDANSLAGGNQAFNFIGSAAFSGAGAASAAQLRAELVSGNWVIQGDTNGDGIADLEILVTTGDSHIIGASDFIL